MTARSPSASAATVTVVLAESDGSTATISSVSEDFEPGERGLMIGRRFVPWHRVERFWWDLAPKAATAEDRAGPRVRLVIEDGTAAGEVVTVPTELFEVGAGAVTVVQQTPIEDDPRMVNVRRLGIPWHRLREYERIAAGPEDLRIPER
ncbi:MAG TPA: hypothetical protein VK646_06415 [Actinomycetota bacterium]|nr:hypothetical protein [Actinomycetota bacterium]